MLVLNDVFLGLAMELFVNQSDFLQTTDRAGLKIIIHQYNSTVITSNEGFDIPVGYLISLSVKEVSLID